jgi:hypothetical protein
MFNSKNFPAAFAAMDEAASDLWAYPDAEWQHEFLMVYATVNNDTALLSLLEGNDTEDDDDGLTRADLAQFYGPSVRI